MDGTFDLVPKGWKQLLTLHAKHGESFVPCLHALLPKKSGGTYGHFFDVVRRLIPSAKVNHMHVDYERTLISSFVHRFNCESYSYGYILFYHILTPFFPCFHSIFFIS